MTPGARRGGRDRAEPLFRAGRSGRLGPVGTPEGTEGPTVPSPSAPAAAELTSSVGGLIAHLSEHIRPPYLREGEIDRGGMGSILRVRDETLRRDLAMK